MLAIEAKHPETAVLAIKGNHHKIESQNSSMVMVGGGGVGGGGVGGEQKKNMMLGISGKQYAFC